MSPIVRVEIQRAPRRWAPSRWHVLVWRQYDADLSPVADGGELYVTAKAARARARELRRRIRAFAIECWCGASATREEDLFDDSGLEALCGGLGVLACSCGGDFCACHNHGAVECSGCRECQGGDESDLGEPDPSDEMEPAASDYDDAIGEELP